MVNPTDQPQIVSPDVQGARLTGEGMSWIISGLAGKLAHNDPGKPRMVDIREEQYRNPAGRLSVAAPERRSFRVGGGRTANPGMEIGLGEAWRGTLIMSLRTSSSGVPSGRQASHPFGLGFQRV